MSRTIVGVLRGGTSNEYNLSIKTGAAMLQALPEERYETRDIFIDKSGMWHMRGMPVDSSRALSQVDVVLNGLHGGVGEDGTVQRVLARSGVPFTGSRAQASLLSLNKVRAKAILERAGVRIPRGIAFNLENRLNTAEMAQAVFAQFGPPYVIKPVSEGASYGILIAMTIVELPDSIADVLDEFGDALVEEYIRGDEFSVGLVENFRDQELYALPPARVLLPEGAKYFHYDAHEQALAQYEVPSHFSHSEKMAIENLAKIAHRALGMSHFSRADVILTRRGPYLLEINALPGLYAGASLPPMLESIGSSPREYLEHAIDLAHR
ncbi:MAG TPA: ATP-grasp domain-containing protein [Candidatus Paceibacterota bacterium]